MSERDHHLERLEASLRLIGLEFVDRDNARDELFRPDGIVMIRHRRPHRLKMIRRLYRAHARGR